MPEPTAPPPPKKGRGCLFYGCLTCIVLLIIVGLIGFFTVRFLKNKFDAYTDAAPMQLPKVEMAEAEYQTLQERVKGFGEAMDQGKPTEPLTLTERELNALIAKSKNAEEFADKVHVSLEGDQVKGQVSIPLSGLGWIGKGRYLNGEATFNVSLENGVLIVTARDVVVKGKPLPETFMVKLREENLAKDVYKNEKNAEAVRRLESLQVKDGVVTIKARAP